MSKKFTALSFTVALALAGVMGLLWLLDGIQVALAQAGTGVIRVATTGSDTPGCGGATPCQTVQYAVDQAQADEEVRVASGLYTGVQGRPAPSEYLNPPASGVITQVVYISKTVTIRGGYTTAFTDPPDPETNPTTLDAQGEGRVLFITGNISPTIEGLHITGGDAAGLRGTPWGGDAGGGVYVISATATINNNWVFSNTADVAGGGLALRSSNSTVSANTIISNTAALGGGLYLRSSSNSTVSGNTIMSNGGGGLFLWDSAAMLNDNAVAANISGDGGGLRLYESSATLSGNTISDNTADRGGGLYLGDSNATLSGNTVISNSANGTLPEDGGGGLYLGDSNATLSGNTVMSNTAKYGGGLSLWWYSAATLSGNTIISNIAALGGGLYLEGSDATLSGNTIISNTAVGAGGGLCLHGGGNATLIGDTVISNTAGWDGGGLYLNAGTTTLSGSTVMSNTAGRDGGGLFLAFSMATLTDTVVADNQVGASGSGLYIVASSSRLVHTTIARNSGGDGTGVYAATDAGVSANVTLTNTILVSHTLGITVTAGSTATLESTLWHGNGTDRGGVGTINHSNDYTGDPLFATDGYHLLAGSEAIDKGVDAGVTTDIDGDPRDSAPDLGADERVGIGTDVYLPILLKNASP